MSQEQEDTDALAELDVDALTETADLRDLEDLPAWVAEAEVMYFSRKLSSQKAVAVHFEKSPVTVNRYAKMRRWHERRKDIEQQAARALNEKIRSDSVQDLVDTFSKLDGDILAAGRRAGHYIANYTAQIIQETRKAQQKGRMYIPPQFPNQLLTLVNMARAIRPQEHESEGGLLADIGALLNPREDAPPE